MTPDSDEAAARQEEWFRARVAAVGEPERDRLSTRRAGWRPTRTPGWKDETASPHAARGSWWSCHLPDASVASALEHARLALDVERSPVGTCECFGASYWSISAYSTT